MMPHKTRLSLAVLLALGYAFAVMGAGSDTHRPAAQYAARLSAEPFKSGWKDCFGAMVPDQMIDYLLDLSYAPLNGKAPVEVLFRVFAKEWAGTKLIEDLKVTPEEEVARRFKRIKSVHSHDHGQWTDKVHWLVWPHASGTDANLSGVLPRFWNLFILDLPQPDGTRVDLNVM
jgi:hypothetical protein